MFIEEKPQHDCNESKPFSNSSSEIIKMKFRQIFNVELKCERRGGR